MMHKIVPHPIRTLNTGSRPSGQRLILQFSIDKKVVCQTEYHLTAATRFIEVPLPILHRLKMGAMK